MTKEEKRAYMALYRQKNAEKIAAQRKSYAKAYYQANSEQILAKNRAYYDKNKEAISKKRAEKGAAPRPEYMAAYRKVNRDLHLAYFKKRYQEKRVDILSKQAIYQKLNKESVNRKNRAWAKANPLRVRVNTAIRRSRVRLATPNWADKQAIRDVYLEASYMQMEVDHIIPLNNELVCGLHVWENLQLLSVGQNRAKGNSFFTEEVAL